MNTYYITFGSDPRFPYPSRYLTVEAESEQMADKIFQSAYPNREGSNALNYAFLYDEDEWNHHIRNYYALQDPAAELSMSLNKQFVQVIEQDSVPYWVDFLDGQEEEAEYEEFDL